MSWVQTNYRSFSKKIQEAEVPEKDGVTFTWLKLMTFTSSNNRTFLRILRFIGFINESNKPTQTWKTYRNTTRAGKILAKAIRQSYAELFAIQPKAYNSTDDELKGFFREKTGKDDAMVGRIMLTFKTVCELADFEGVEAETTPSQPEQPPAGDTSEQKLTTVYRGLGKGVTVNINIQLTLPETKDPEVYKSFFQALKNNLLDTESKKKND